MDILRVIAAKMDILTAHKNKLFVIAGAIAIAIVVGGTALKPQIAFRAFNLFSGVNQQAKEITASMSQGQEKDKTKINGIDTAKNKVCEFNTLLSPNTDKLIFKEIAWMGDKNDSKNEWLSVQKTAAGDLNIGGYQIINENGRLKIILPQNTVLNDDNPIFILARNENIEDVTVDMTVDMVFSGTIKNSNEGLRLFDGNCELLDEVLAHPDWPAGNNATKETMKRDLSTLLWYDSSRPLKSPQVATSENSLNASSVKIPAVTVNTPSPSTWSATEKININTASKEELTTLSGIGEVKAAAIIDYRNNQSPFYQIEDIMNVNGIGPTIFDNIKDQITAGDIIPSPVPAPQNPTPSPAQTTPQISPAESASSQTASSSQTDSSSQTTNILISEVMAGINNNSSYEFIELYNPGSEAIDLTGWTIKKKTSAGTESTLVVASRLSGKIILAGKYFLLANQSGYTGAVAYDIAWPSSYTLAQTNNMVTIYDENGATVDTVSWSEIPEGNSFSRNAWDNNNFTVTDPTPQNSSS